MDNQETKCSGQSVALAFIGGGRGWNGGRSSSRPEVGGGNAPGVEGVCQEDRGRSLGEGEGGASRS